MKKIYIDIGHGGPDSGAVYRGRQEKDDVLRLGLLLGKILTKAGCEVRYSRKTDIEDDIVASPIEANEWDTDYYISLHRNSFEPNQAKGVEAWVYSRTAPGTQTMIIAQRIVNNVCKLGFVNRGVKRGAANYPDYAVTKNTYMPACLLETGFVDSDSDNALFDKHINDIAYAIAEGILDRKINREVTPKPPTPKKPTPTPKKKNREDLWRVQIGAYANEKTARELEAKAKAAGFETFVIPPGFKG